MIQINKLQILLIIPFFLSACAHDHSPDDGHNHGDATHAEDDGHNHGSTADDVHEGETHAEDEVHLTAAQIATIGLETGSFQPIKSGGFIKTNGIMDLPPDEFASLTAPAEGFVKTTKGEFLVGSYVRKGTVLATLEHPNYIQMQQDYLEVVAQVVFRQQEVDRQRTLNEANAGTLRKFQEAESNLKVLQARKEGLKQQLRYLGISTKKVEEGNISSTIALAAPISGYITALNIHKGKFVGPQEELYEIVNNDHVHLELDIFEKDIANVKEGQRITFKAPSLGDEIFEGVVKLVSKAFNMENKTIRVHGHILGKHPAFIRGLYLDAKIWTDERTVDALPSEAIVLEEGLNYIFIKEGEENGETVFRKVLVKTGISDGNFVEVSPIEPLEEGTEIVTKETFFLFATMNKGELDHVH